MDYLAIRTNEAIAIKQAFFDWTPDMAKMLAKRAEPEMSYR